MLADQCFSFFFGLNGILIFSDKDTFGPRRAYMQLIYIEIPQLCQFVMESASIWQKKINNEKLEW